MRTADQVAEHYAEAKAGFRLLRCEDAALPMYWLTLDALVQERKRIPTQSIARVGAVLGDLREVIANGLFVHAPDEESCKWCDYGHACGQNAAERAEAKQADPKLAPFAKLVAHE